MTGTFINVATDPRRNLFGWLLGARLRRACSSASWPVSASRRS